MKASELRSKSVEELKLELKDLQREQFNLRFQKKLNQLSSTHEMRQVRRNIARVNTVLADKLRTPSAQ